MAVAPGADVVVVGAGLAGLAAAVALAEAGARVTLLERRPELGGRAYSYRHPVLEETVDSQHVVLGCCTNLLDLYGKACAALGATERIRWYDELVFLEPKGWDGRVRRSVMRPGGLPAPLHQTMSFLRAPMLGWRDKAVIARGLMEFLRGYPATDEESFAAWVRRTGQTDRAVTHFWQPVVVGALNDTFDRCSTKYAGQVFHESFLKSAQGGRLGIPAEPLTEFFAPVMEQARKLGVRIETKCGVDGLTRQAGAWEVRCGERVFEAGAVVLAGGFREVGRLLEVVGLGESHASESMRGAHTLAGSAQGSDARSFDELGSGAPGLLGGLKEFGAAPITTVHLWFDRDVTGMDHAVLLDTRIEWMFCKSRIRGWEAGRGSYVELVISASWPEIEKGRGEILEPALEEAKMFFPAMRLAKLVKSTVLKEARATFSVMPGLDRYRPDQSTWLPGLFVAGDWTRTGWPSTMEGAVRSGRLAAGAVMGERRRFLSADLAARGLMRWLV